MQQVEEVSIFQWNILADSLEPYGIPDWNSRKEGVLNWIQKKNADIVCLEEVNHYSAVEEFLISSGYKGKFVQKRHGGGSIPDGTAIFWKEDKFQCLHDFEIRFPRWNQVGLSLLLEASGSGRTISVTATHLKAYQTESEEQVREQQVQQFIDAVKAWVESKSLTPSLWIFAGDLNSTLHTFPTPSSSGWQGRALFKFLENGYRSVYHDFNWEGHDISEVSRLTCQASHP
jgi:mRNA deadenylase 3'-5' endonuclease subunit Ccr4